MERKDKNIKISSILIILFFILFIIGIVLMHYANSISSESIFFYGLNISSISFLFMGLAIWMKKGEKAEKDKTLIGIMMIALFSGVCSICIGLFVLAMGVIYGFPLFLLGIGLILNSTGILRGLLWTSKTNY